MDPKHSPINYLYFGGLFSLLVVLIAGSIFTKENLGGAQFFFFFYALGQVILEIALFVFLGILVRRYLGKFCFALFIGATFIALVLHLCDFMMDRVLDLSVWSALRIFVFEENLANFLFLLDASGIPLWLWGVFFLFLLSLPFFGVLIYKTSEMLVRKKPFSPRTGLFLQTFLCIPAALFFWDFSASKVIDPDVYTSFLNSLPWKRTFLQPQSVLYSLPAPLSEPPSETLVAATIAQDQTTLAHKPNIYLFIIESLREDAITADIAPHLHHFKNFYTHFDLALSNGNGSHLSWYSIFHSQFSHCWNRSKKQWKMGSPALALLKKWGYQVRLYSSAQLGYYGMEELLFGDQHQLLDSAHYFHHTPPIAAADTDAAALAHLQKDLRDNPSLQQGQVFIVFWDCTHFDYNWPKNWTPKFIPFAKEFAYFQAFHSQKTLAQLKSRYHNSVNYMDSLFGHFMEQLPNKKEAIIVVSGDHGEEFFEHGHLFHNSHISHEQTHIPLYFKFGHETKPLFSRPVVTQIDIFPSLIDYLANTSFSFLEGHSIFQQPKWPYALISRFNAGGTPYEFCLHNGTHKLIAQFQNRNDIFASKQLQILSLRSSKDKTIYEHKRDIKGWIQTEFAPAFDRLCKAPNDSL